MKAISQVEAEVDKVLGLLDRNKQTTSKLIDQLIDKIEAAKCKLNENREPIQNSLTAEQITATNQLCDNIKKTCSGISNSHRELHVSVSKIGKAIDRNFIADYSCVADAYLFASSENTNLLNQAIVEHLLRHGAIDVAKELIRESNLTLKDEHFQYFVDVDKILNSLRNKDTKPALAWAMKNQSKLRNIKSSLEFRLHRLNVIEMLKQGISQQNNIIQYAREYLSAFGHEFPEEVQYLMGSIAYLSYGIDASPYKSILEPINYEEVEQIFMSDACALLGCSRRSPIAIAIDGGAIALPPLINMNQIMVKQGIQHVYRLKDELPIEIDLGPKLHFHSIFSCPILKQQATDNNPPMRLVCGHVISREAVHKIYSQTQTGKLKCPLCPMEMRQSDPKRVHF